MARVSLQQVVKRYPKAPAPAVKEISFDVEEGELLVVLGPSGCGKTSTLRMIAGLETVTAGRISFDDAMVNDVPPARRNVAMAFENYGLYDHWTVYQNIAYPLRLRGEEGPALDGVVRDVAAKLDIGRHLGERPAALSGGIRQRVGLARALVRRPSVFLLDEPMSHVDADLRNDMRAEIRRIHQDVGSTMIIVTHDQLDALAMADRVLVMDDGRIEQHAPPEVVYDTPATAFVAGFIGEPPMNMVTVDSAADVVAQRLVGAGSSLSREGATVAFRPHRTRVMPVTPQDAQATAGDLVLPGTVYMVEPLGDRAVVSVRMVGELLKAEVADGWTPAVGEDVRLLVAKADLHYFDADSGRRVENREGTGTVAS